MRIGTNQHRVETEGFMKNSTEKTMRLLPATVMNTAQRRRTITTIFNNNTKTGEGQGDNSVRTATDEEMILIRTHLLAFGSFV